MGHTQAKGRRRAGDGATKLRSTMGDAAEDGGAHPPSLVEHQGGGQGERGREIALQIFFEGVAKLRRLGQDAAVLEQKGAHVAGVEVRLT